MHKHDKDSSYSQICESKKRLTEEVINQLNGGIEKIDAHEMGEVIDMIKDLAEAEKCMNESRYYESIVEAMEEGSEDPYGMRAGYRPRMMAYKPFISEEPYIDAYLRDGDPTMRMGYSRGSSSSRGGRRNRDSMGRYTSNRGRPTRPGYDDGEDWDMDYDEDDDPRYSEAYNQYRSARRHYTESHSQHDKDVMNQKANEHIASTISTVRDMWKDADPNLRKRMKADFSALLNEMNV